MKFKEFLTDLKDYFLSVYFWKTVLYLAIFITVVLVGVSIYLRIYTRHGQTILTPEFRGMTLEQAEKIAHQKHLNLVVIDSIYEGVGQPGTIVDQTPPTNFHVKKGRSIFVTIKALTPKLIAVPDVTQNSLIQADYDLRRVGFKLGKIKYETSYNFDNLVLAMLYNGDTLKPGTKLPIGSKIDLIVAKRPSSALAQADTTLPDSLKNDTDNEQMPDF